MMLAPDKAWYEAKLKDASVEVIVEILDSPNMKEETREIFKVLLAEGELDLLKERLAGWLANFAKEKF